MCFLDRKVSLDSVTVGGLPAYIVAVVTPSAFQRLEVADLVLGNPVPRIKNCARELGEVEYFQRDRASGRGRAGRNEARSDEALSETSGEPIEADEIVSELPFD